MDSLLTFCLRIFLQNLDNHLIFIFHTIVSSFSEIRNVILFLFTGKRQRMQTGTLTNDQTRAQTCAPQEMFLPCLQPTLLFVPCMLPHRRRVLHWVMKGVGLIPPRGNAVTDGNRHAKQNNSRVARVVLHTHSLVILHRAWMGTTAPAAGFMTLWPQWRKSEARCTPFRRKSNT